jgi:hypothetical protein
MKTWVWKGHIIMWSNVETIEGYRWACHKKYCKECHIENKASNVVYVGPSFASVNVGLCSMND